MMSTNYRTKNGINSASSFLDKAAEDPPPGGAYATSFRNVYGPPVGQGTAPKITAMEPIVTPKKVKAPEKKFLANLKFGNRNAEGRKAPYNTLMGLFTYLKRFADKKRRKRLDEDYRSRPLRLALQS